jgi:hypothetical protein
MTHTTTVALSLILAIVVVAIVPYVAGAVLVIN